MFVYNGIRTADLRKKALEITVWDYVKYDANDFLGEVVLDLANARLGEEPEWHSLTSHLEHRQIGYVNISSGLKLPECLFFISSWLCCETHSLLLCDHLPVAMEII